MAKNILVFTATYNEADNIGNLISEITNYLPEADILVVDDNSPDGTSDIVNKLKEQNSKINLITRPAKNGLGTAHLLAKRFAYKHGYESLVTMDADFSHHPKYLPNFKELLKNHDFVIGSRYCKGGHCEYGFIRTLISKGANFLTHLLLNVKTQETTTSYRGFNRKTLEYVLSNKINSNGYSYCIEVMFLIRNLENVAEFPIYFEDRREGSSKISSIEILNGFKTLAILFLKRIFRFSLKSSLDLSQLNCEKCNDNYFSETDQENLAKCLVCNNIKEIKNVTQLV
jgi:dolichol-phosphate mannosyltransferase